MVTQSTQNAKDIKFAVNLLQRWLQVYRLLSFWLSSVLPWLLQVVIFGRDIVDYCTHSTHAMTGSLC